MNLIVFYFVFPDKSNVGVKFFNLPGSLKIPVVISPANDILEGLLISKCCIIDSLMEAIANRNSIQIRSRYWLCRISKKIKWVTRFFHFNHVSLC